jgi:hypothetical protein
MWSLGADGEPMKIRNLPHFFHMFGASNFPRLDKQKRPRKLAGVG